MMNEIGYIAFIAPGGPELIFILMVLLLLFGAKDAPKIMRNISEVLTRFRHTANSFKHDIMYSDMRAEADSREEKLYDAIDEELRNDDLSENNDDILINTENNLDNESNVESN